MSDYFTHLARRTLGIAAGSDARPIGAVRATSEAPRPVLFPEEGESVPALASAPAPQIQPGSALRPSPVDAAHVQRNPSRAVDELRTDALSGSPNGTLPAPDAGGLGALAVAATPDVSQVQAVTSDRVRTTAAPQDSFLGMAQQPVPTARPILPSVRNSLAQSASPSTSIEEARGPVSPMRAGDGEASTARGPAASWQDVEDSDRAHGTLPSRGSVFTEAGPESMDAAAQKSASVQPANAVGTADKASVRPVRVTSKDIVYSDEDRLRTETDADVMMQTPRDAKTWTAEPFAETPSGSLRMGSSAQNATAPQVHIHIGRIEVRSPQVMQPQRQTASAESRPTLSLASVLSMAKGK